MPSSPAGILNQGKANGSVPAPGSAPAAARRPDPDPEVVGAEAGSEAKRARVEGWGAGVGGGQDRAGAAAYLDGGGGAPSGERVAPRQEVSLIRSALVVSRSVPLVQPSNSGLRAALVCLCDACRLRERVAVMRACRQASSS